MTDTYRELKDKITSHRLSISISILRIMENLGRRGERHDVDKYKDDLLSGLSTFSNSVNKPKYGTKEYYDFVETLQPILKKHYNHPNSGHHPQHYENGINGMSLMDLMEMLADWKTASCAYEDGDILNSLKVGIERFGISDQLADILLNTIKELKWERQV